MCTHWNSLRTFTGDTLEQRDIRSVEFNLIKFRPISPTTASGRRFSEGGGWMLGDTQFCTSNSIPFCPPRSMFHLTIADSVDEQADYRPSENAKSAHPTTLHNKASQTGHMPVLSSCASAV
jgi:hypothetical protein